MILCSCLSGVSHRFIHSPPKEQQTSTDDDLLTRLFSPDKIMKKSTGYTSTLFALAFASCLSSSCVRSCWCLCVCVVYLPFAFNKSQVMYRTSRALVDGQLMLQAFPNLFPYGRCGVLKSAEDSHEYQEALFRRYLLRFHDRRFSRDPFFVFWMLNNMLRRNALYAVARASDDAAKANDSAVLM